jgi:hypothetical protein
MTIYSINFIENSGEMLNTLTAESYDIGNNHEDRSIGLVRITADDCPATLNNLHSMKLDIG